jgi:hypothetical protein
MKKRILCILLVISIILVATSCNTSNENHSDSVEETAEVLTLETLKNTSAYCCYISSEAYYETKNDGNKIYTTVYFTTFNLWHNENMEGEIIDAKHVKGLIDYHPGMTEKIITIIENDKSYIKPNSKYVVFLNKAEEENCYYLSHGKSSLFISLTDTGYIVPLDYKLNKEVKEQWENRLSEYLAWFEENYPEPSKDENNSLQEP